MWPFTRQDPRIGDEVRFHRDRLVDDYVSRGMNRQDAERRACHELGNVGDIEESVRDVRGRWLEDVGKDLHYAARTLRRTPGFAVVAILSLALGIGANTAIFSLVNALMLRPLPVAEPDRLVRLARLTTDPRSAGFVSYPIFEHLRDHLTTVSNVFAQGKIQQSVIIGGEEDVVAVDLVSGAYAEVLGLRPSAGRLLDPGDDTAAPAALAAVITDTYWQRRFDRHPSAIGTAVTVRNKVFTIVGVTPAGYQSAEAGRTADLLLPLTPVLTDEQRTSIGSNTLVVLGRLAPGSSVEQADAETASRFQAFMTSQSAGLPERRRAEILTQRAGALPAPDGFNPMRALVARPLLVLMGIVGLILLLACVNLSGLLLARAAARRREISVRLAIGASRGRLMRQLLTESLVLALVGGGLGLVTAGWFSDTLFSLFAAGREITLSVAPDWRVLVFTAVTSLTACVLAGLLPALRGARTALNPALKQVRAHGPGRLGRTLVVAQLAVSMILIVAATLFIGTVVELRGVDRGFESRGVLVATIRSTARYDPARGMAVQRALLERLRRLRGVVASSAVQMLPIGGGLWDRTVQVEGYTFRPEESNSVGFNAIAPGYFATLGTPLLAGREFTERDTATTSRVAIVNQRFEHEFFGTQSAIGRHVTSVGITYEIVGVVRDAAYQSLRDAPMRTMYVTWAGRTDDPPTRYSYLLRVGRGDPLRLVPALERAVRDVDPTLRLAGAPATYDTVIDRSIATERLLATLGGLFGLLALVMGGLGLFGMLAFQVGTRTSEFGVRLVLGASRRTMAGLVLRDIVIMLVPGLAIGSLAALALTDVTRAMLFRLTPRDPDVYIVASIVLTGAALLAGWFPMRRAARVDPLVVLRSE